MDDVPSVVQMLTEAAKERGHFIGTDADVVFALSKPELVDRLKDAEAVGHFKKCVIVLRATHGESGLERRFWKSGQVKDILNAPFSTTAASSILEALENGSTSDLD